MTRDMTGRSATWERQSSGEFASSQPSVARALDFALAALGPARSPLPFGPFSIPDIAPGDYDVLFESPGLISTTQRATVQPAIDSGAVAFLDLPRQPLNITSVSPNVVDASSWFQSLEVAGSGFRVPGRGIERADGNDRPRRDRAVRVGAQ